MPSQDPTQTPLSEADQRQILELYQHIRRRGAHWVGPDGRSESLAATLPEFLAKLNTRLSEGQWVALGQNPVQLTAAEAAHILGVSRQFLIGQLKAGEIPFHMVGTHYRLYVKDVLAYQMQRDNKWRRVQDALNHAEVEGGFDDQERPGNLTPAPQLDSADPPLQEPPEPLPPVLADLSAAGVEEVLDDSVSGAPDPDSGVSGVSVERPVDLKPERQLELPTTPTQPAPTSVQLAPPSQSGQAPEPVPAASAESVSSSSLAAEKLEARRLVTELLRAR